LLNLSDATFQGQYDPSFWFSETPGAVSRALNSVIDLSAIDRTMAAASAAVRQAKSAVADAKQRSDHAERRAADLQWITGFDGNLKKAEIVQAEADRLHGRVDAAANLLLRAKNATNSLKLTQAKIAIMSEAMIAASAAVAANANVTAMAMALADVARIKKALTRTMPDSKTTTAALAEARRRTELCQTISGLRERAVECVGRLASARSRIQSLETEALQLRSQVKNCPTCGRAMP
jgi:hypothetical protein